MHLYCLIQWTRSARMEETSMNEIKSIKLSILEMMLLNRNYLIRSLVTVMKIDSLRENPPSDHDNCCHQFL